MLIKMPMEVFQLNRAGLQLLQRALQARRPSRSAVAIGSRGASAADLPDPHLLLRPARSAAATAGGRARTADDARGTRFEGSFTRYPVLSEIAVTYRCNLACSFCYAGCGTADASPGNAARERHRQGWKIWRERPGGNGALSARDPLRQEMTAAEVIQVIDQLATLGKVPSVSFTGGECTLRPELPEFIAHARQPWHAGQHHYQRRRLQLTRLCRRAGRSGSHVGPSQPVGTAGGNPRSSGTETGRV